MMCSQSQQEEDYNKAKTRYLTSIDLTLQTDKSDLDMADYIFALTREFLREYPKTDSKD